MGQNTEGVLFNGGSTPSVFCYNSLKHTILYEIKPETQVTLGFIA